MVSKVDECSSATEVCKSVDILQAIRWSAMAWNDGSQSKVVKCFIKAGILNSEGETNAVEAAGGDVDPFAELDSDIGTVEELAKETSGTNVISIKETVAGCFDPPTCHELPDNWEDSFFAMSARLKSSKTTTTMTRMMKRFKTLPHLSSQSLPRIVRQYLALKTLYVF